MNLTKNSTRFCFSFLAIFAFLLLFSCENNRVKPNVDYGDLPADTARYLELCDILETDSTNPELFYERGVYLFNKKKLNKAGLDLQKAIQLDSTNVKYLNLMGEMSFLANQSKQSVSYYEKSLTIDPENYDALVKLGEIYYYVKEHIKSHQCYDRALKVKPECVACYFFKGMNYKEMKNLPDFKEKALAAFLNVLKIEPENYDAMLQVGIVYSELNPVKALPYLNAALTQRPNGQESLYARAYCYQNMKQYDSAMADYQRLINLNPKNPYTYFNIGYVQMIQGNWAKAVEGYKMATKADSDYTDAWFNLGLCYEKLNQNREATEAYQNCLKSNPNYDKAKMRLSKLL